MNPTALQILRAALERIGATNGYAVNQNVDGDARECVACGHYVDHCAVQSCEGHMARAALEAADKAPMDDAAQRLAHAFVLPSMCPSELCSFDEEGQCTAWRFHEHAQKQIDAYQRGGAKP